MKLLMIGHLLGDFYFQTNKLSAKKQKSFVFTMLHCLIYSVVMFFVLFAGNGKLSSNNILVALAAGGLHLVVDEIKCIVNKVCKRKTNQLGIFLFDQCIHFIFLVVICCIYTIEIDISWIVGISQSIVNNINKYLVIICALLFCGKPAAVIVSLVFGLIPRTIENAEDSIKGTEGNKTQEKVKIGSWIGILEREIMLILGLLGEYGAIGFVIAAKSLARHNQFNNPAFAEKYLIGTLLSSLIALVSIIVCSVP